MGEVARLPRIRRTLSPDERIAMLEGRITKLDAAFRAHVALMQDEVHGLRAKLEAQGVDGLTSRPSLHSLALDVAQKAGLSLSDLMSDRRDREVSFPRQDLMRMAVDLGMSLPQIARFLVRDHTTVMHGVRMSRKRQAAKEGSANG